jgi:branched-chain amino acid transport system substrate-binding protein
VFVVEDAMAKGGRPWVVLAILMLVLVGPGGLSVPDPLLAQGGSSEPIVLGLIGVLSGPLALNGEFCSRGAILAVEEINAGGGVTVPGGGKRPFKLVVEDDGGQPPNAVSAANKLIQSDKAFAILGPDFSNNVLPTLAITKRHEVLHIYSTLSGATTKPDVRSDFAFRTRAEDSVWARAAADYIANTLGRTRKVGISNINIEYGITGAQVLTEALKANGMTPVARASHKFGDLDLTPSAAAMVRAGVEVVANWDVQNTGVLLLRALRNLGWSGTYLHSTPDPILINIGREFVNGVTGPQNWAYTDPRPQGQRFAHAYNKRWSGQWPSSHSVGYYDAVHLIKEGIERAGLSTKAVRDHLAGLKRWEGVQGTFRPAELRDGNVTTAVVMIEIRNQQPVIVKRYE